jgi:hypothetical protein
MEPTPQQEAEALRRLVTEHGMTNVEALAQLRAEERGRRLAQRINPHTKIVAPKENQ